MYILSSSRKVQGAFVVSGTKVQCGVLYSLDAEAQLCETVYDVHPTVMG
jgi:hypothetical protein